MMNLQIKKEEGFIGEVDDGLSLSLSDRAIKSSRPIKVEESMATEWTDEKHSLYLNSIEASFVNQLYSSEYHSTDLLGWLRTRNTSSSGLNPKNLSGQFKVLRGGCWDKHKFESGKSDVSIENDSSSLYKNPWIQHFRSHSIGKKAHVTLPGQVDNKKLASQSTHLVNQRQEREAANSKQPSSFRHISRVVSIGSITEVSDQNFVDMEVETREESSSSSSKKRARSAISPTKDQVVPFARLTSGGKTAYPKDSNEESCSKRLEYTRNFAMEPEASLFKCQEINDPEFKCG